ncbi:MAG: hypothetical protein V1867_05820 [Candidatus Falkowbacteria bacterium]
MTKKYFLLSIIAIGLGLAFNGAGAAEFNPNNIISDAEMLDSGTMTLSEIQAFLDNQGGYLARYKTANFEGKIKTAAEIIYDAAVNNYDCGDAEMSSNPTEAERKIKCKPARINPRLLLVLLQKEQSLIDDTSPTPRQLDWATGYGCPDGGGCNSRWQGFGKQVNSAALQFFDYVTNPHLYSYKAGNTYTITNTGRPSQSVTPANNATAALYNYTPHVYNGNFNFHKLWMRYFTFTYPNGSLLQVKGEAGVWLIQKGQKRPFLSKGALTSRFDIKKVLQVGKSELDRYPKGAPIKFPQYSLVRSPRGTIFLLVDDTRRGFDSTEAFRKIGYNPEEVMNASWEDINAYREGIPLTATTSYPTGALLQDKTTGGIYWVSDGTKAPLWDAVLLKTKFKGKAITPETPEKLAGYKTVEPAIFGDGELIKSSASPAVYVIDNGKRRAIASGQIFEDMGYRWENVITITPKIMALYEVGEPLSEIYAAETETDDNAADAPETTATSTADDELNETINNILNP